MTSSPQRRERMFSFLETVVTSDNRLQSRKRGSSNTAAISALRHLLHHVVEGTVTGSRPETSSISRSDTDANTVTAN